MFYSQTQSGCLINIPFFFNGYKLIRFLNSGFFSIVVKVEEKCSCQQYAAKIISKKEMRNENKTELILNEINILRSFNHPNIIKLYDVFEIKNDFNDEYYVLIMEYCSNGDLFDYATQIGFKDENEKKKIMFSFLKAIEYIHSNGISHGDIKPENILLDDDLNPKICDFGFCKTCIYSKDQKRNFSICYAAPELFKRSEINMLKADIWAIGITLYCLSEFSFPFLTGDDEFIAHEIQSGELTIITEEKLQSLVEKCTKMCPNCRPNIKEILNDEFFKI